MPLAWGIPALAQEIPALWFNLYKKVSAVGCGSLCMVVPIAQLLVPEETASSKVAANWLGNLASPSLPVTVLLML